MADRTSSGERRDGPRDQSVKERAYRIWEAEGRPEGRAEVHWDMASELVAIEESQKDTLKPHPGETYANSPTGDPVEPMEVAHNQGEFPTLVDQGEETAFPDRDAIADADRPPLAAPSPAQRGKGARQGAGQGAGKAARNGTGKRK